MLDGNPDTALFAEVASGLLQHFVALSHSEAGFLARVEMQADASFGLAVCAGEAPPAVDDVLVPTLYAGEPDIRDDSMVLPLVSQGILLGVVGLSGRPGGYHSAVAEPLVPLARAAADLMGASALRAELRYVEQARREKEASLQAMLDGSLDGALLCDERGEIRSANLRACRLFGYREVELVGRNIGTLFSSGDGAEARLWNPASIAPLRKRQRTLAKAHDGTCFPVELSLAEGRFGRSPVYATVVRVLRDGQQARTGDRGAPAAHLARDRMVGESPAMSTLFHSIAQVSAGDWTVLIHGETGSGKELVARAIHESSPRSAGPFIPVNCASMNENLLSDQLFGHARGAFTGANSEQPGLFEAAAGGTLFLDEIGDISHETQRALLRVLEDRLIRRLGETKARTVDVRIISATHRDLPARVAAGRFREDLLYRIRVARIEVPPLRARRSDVPLLAASFLEQVGLRRDPPINVISEEAMGMLTAHDWPGNVRELKSAIEHAVIHARGAQIEAHDLPPEVRGNDSPIRDQADGRPEPVSPAVSGAGVPGWSTRERIVEALARAGGNRSRAARALGIGRSTLYRRLKTLGIPTRASERSHLESED